MTGDDSLPTALAWLGVVLVTVSGALSALLECSLVPLYAGSTILPLAVPITLVLNVLLPVLGRLVTGRSAGAVAPFVGWLIAIVALGFVVRPEGDVLLPGGGPGHVAWVTYSVLFGGLVAGGITVSLLSNPRPAPHVTTAGEQPGA